MNKSPKKPHSVKPVLKDGQLVTPVTNLPAAARNWAPPCNACSVRQCVACEELVDHREAQCPCGGALGEKQPCPKTRVQSTQDRVQIVKCERCGHSWSHALQRGSDRR